MPRIRKAKAVFIVALCGILGSCAANRHLPMQGFIDLHPGDSKERVIMRLEASGKKSFVFDDAVSGREGLGVIGISHDSFFYAGVFVFFDQAERVKRISLMTPMSCERVPVVYHGLFSEGTQLAVGRQDTSIRRFIRYRKEDVSVTADCAKPELLIEITELGKHPQYEPIMRIKTEHLD
jgi:hypothetical protein